MEKQQEQLTLSDKQVRMILVWGLILSAISIIFSVETLFREQRYVELGFATALFSCVLILIRKFNISEKRKSIA